MGKKYRNLYPNVWDRESLNRAYKRTSKGKRTTRGYLEFKEDESLNLSNLHDELISEEYTPNIHNSFFVYEPKERLINALPFRDRIVQHSLYETIEPIFDATFLTNSYACRKEKGTHKAAIHTQSTIRKIKNQTEHPYYIQIDFSKYFHSIDVDLLLKEFDRKVTCESTRTLFRKFHNPGTKGIPIGYLTSQLAANIFGNIVDHYIKHTLRPFDFIRYMDDIVLLVQDRELAQNMLSNLKSFITNLGLSFSRWKIDKVDHGIDFVGYRLWETHKLLRRSSVTRAKKVITKCNNDSYRERFITSWKGHVDLADSYNLLTFLDLVETGYK